MKNTSRAAAYTADMTEGTPIRHILLFAIPLFIGTVFQQFYNFADTMIAGRSLGDQAIAAIGAPSTSLEHTLLPRIPRPGVFMKC